MKRIPTLFFLMHSTEHELFPFTSKHNKISIADDYNINKYYLLQMSVII